MTYHVGKAHENAYMFCLACDKFFKVERTNKFSTGEMPAASEKVAEELSEPKKSPVSLIRKINSKETLQALGKNLKTAFGKFFTPKTVSTRPAIDVFPEVENISPPRKKIFQKASSQLRLSSQSLLF